MAKRGIIFDLDGTLWDATAAAVDIWNRVFARHGGAHGPISQAEVRMLMGKTMPEIGAVLFPGLPEGARMRIVDDYGEEEVACLRVSGGRLYPHLAEALPALAERYGLYVVSNCQSGYVEAFMEAHRLEAYFDDFEMSGRTGLSKADNIRAVMMRNELTEAVYVGDTEGDRLAAEEAGIPFIWAAYGFGCPAVWDARIEDIDDLSWAVRQIWPETDTEKRRTIP